MCAKLIVMALRPARLLLAALLMSATLGACGGDSEPETSPSITRTVTRTVTAPAATGTVASTTTPTRQACTNLPLPRSVRAQLRDGKLDPGSVFYGKCGDTYWAIGYYFARCPPPGTDACPAGMGIAGETLVFRRQRGQRRWEEHNGCVPQQLLRVWGRSDCG